MLHQRIVDSKLVENDIIIPTNNISQYEKDDKIIDSNGTLKQQNRLFNFTQQQRQGIYFTTDIAIINNIFDIIPLNDLQGKMIFEPACGNGNLITQLMRNIYNSTKSKQQVDNYLQNLIFNDIDKNILSQCIFNIKFLYETFFNTNIKYNLNAYNTDFVKDNTLLNKYKNRIDYVIGNPPYITLYGRRDKKKTEQERQYFLSYKQFPSTLQNGKINYVMLFLERGLDLLKQNGELSYIIDASFNETAYKYTREYLVKNYSIKEITHNISNFDNVASGQIILKINNNKNQLPLKITDYKTNEIYYKNLTINKNFKINYKKENDLCASILNKLNITKIKDIYKKRTIRTCSMLLNRENDFIKEVSQDYKLKENEYWYNVVAKSLNEKFCIMKTHKVLVYDKNLQDKINNDLKIDLIKQGIKNKKRIGMGDVVTFINPKVFIRQSAKSIIATFDNNLSTANNSLYIFSLYDNSQESIDELFFITGFLNSNIATFYAQRNDIIRYFVGKQPQIKIGDLIELPIITTLTIKKQIADCVKNKKYNDVDIILNNYFKLTQNEIDYMNNEIINF